MQLKIFCEGCKYTDIFHVKTVGTFSAKTYSRITVQIIHGLNDIGTEILVIRNTTPRRSSEVLRKI